jgi:hypothetical protein
VSSGGLVCGRCGVGSCGPAIGCDGLPDGCCWGGGGQLIAVVQLLVVMGYLVAVVVGAADCCGVAVGCDG